MAGREQGPDGVMDSVRRFGCSMLGLVHNRLELFAVECQEEKLRALRLLTWFAAAVALGAAGLLVAIGALALLLWHIAGFLGLALLAIAALGAAVAIIRKIQRQVVHGPPPFAETAAEFRKDAACL